MKNKLKLLGIIAMVAIIAVSMTACAKNPFVGTWSGNGNGTTFSIVFTEKTFTMAGGGISYEGTYTRDGNTALLTVDGETAPPIVISGKTLTFMGFSFTKQ